MDHNVNNLIEIEKEIQLKILENNNIIKKPEIIAVSKTFSVSDILPVINHGQVHFGENKVQEALEKWESLKNDFKHIKLHMLGKLQTNKVKHVIKLFDYLHSLDNIKLAEKISLEQKKYNKKLKIFIQVNIGNENTKSGIKPEETKSFLNLCRSQGVKNILGLMCIPPINESPTKHYQIIINLSKEFGLGEPSIGMSGDYLQALNFNPKYIRLGTVLFGKRS